MLSLGLGLEEVPNTRRQTAADLGLLLVLLFLLLNSQSEDILSQYQRIRAYLLFLGSLGFRRGLSGRLCDRRLGGSGCLTTKLVNSRASNDTNDATYASVVGSAGASSVLGASAGASAAGSLGASSGAGEALMNQ